MMLTRMPLANPLADDRLAAPLDIG